MAQGAAVKLCFDNGPLETGDVATLRVALLTMVLNLEAAHGADQLDKLFVVRARRLLAALPDVPLNPVPVVMEPEN